MFQPRSEKSCKSDPGMFCCFFLCLCKTSPIYKKTKVIFGCARRARASERVRKKHWKEVTDMVAKRFVIVMYRISTACGTSPRCLHRSRRESRSGEWLAISSRINTWLFSLFRQTKQPSWNPNRPASPKFNLVFACGYIAQRQHRISARPTCNWGTHGDEPADNNVPQLTLPKRDGLFTNTQIKLIIPALPAPALPWTLTNVSAYATSGTHLRVQDMCINTFD